MSLSDSDCHRLLAVWPAKLPKVQGPVLATRKLRPRSAVITTLRTDYLPVLGRALYPSVWKNGVLVNREAPDRRVVRRSLAHAHSCLGESTSAPSVIRSRTLRVCAQRAQLWRPARHRTP